MTAPITATFSLTDHDGLPVTEHTYRGSWVLVLFGFTHCQMVCPRALSRLSGVLDDLDPAMVDHIRPLYVTVDPARDTPEVMKTFLRSGYPRFTGLTGSEEQIAQAKDSFMIFARAKRDPDAPDGYVVPHTAISYLLDPDGQYATHWTDAAGADVVASELREYVGSERSSDSVPNRID